jgi:hypothetical protein
MLGQAWWYRPVIPEIGMLRQEDLEFKANEMGSTVKACL